MIKKNTLYNIAKQIIPPIIFSFLKKTRIYGYIRRFATKITEEKHIPSWHNIKKGELAGYELFVDLSGMFKEMIEGEYDTFFIDYLNKLDLKGKVIFDIGAHIGFDTLFFAKAVGQKGKVFSFEPNGTNKDRLDLIVARNKKLSNSINTFEYAISNKKGIEEFIFSNLVDNGTSSGSFIEGASTFWEQEIYEKNIGFKRTKVRTIPLDSISELNIHDLPALIKIDVEGAEYLVIEGARYLINKCKPILLIEIHSIFNMLKVGEQLKELNYKINLLKQEPDGRCFISALPN
jgi:FkbM family methyltransferase